jgi:leader peptidase (prepilin peptidase)/N-methyltransferase
MFDAACSPCYTFLMVWTVDVYNWGAVFAFIWGALWGSFFNVVIYRFPLGESLVSPGSRCPQCKTAIRAWHNIPIFGWIMLRAKCAACQAPISIRYPIVEGLTALLATAVWFQVAGGHNLGQEMVLLDVAVRFLLLFAFVGSLIVITFIDLDHQIIPHVITINGMIWGLVASPILEPLTGVGWQESILGILLGAGVIYLIIQVYFWVRKREGMGGGDFMMMGMLGAWLGFESIVFILFAGSIQGLIGAAVMIAKGGAQAPLHEQEASEGEELEAVSLQYAAIPFGPFLALAGLEWFFFASWIRPVIYGMYGLE